MHRTMHLKNLCVFLASATLAPVKSDGHCGLGTARSLLQTKQKKTSQDPVVVTPYLQSDRFQSSYNDKAEEDQSAYARATPAPSASDYAAYRSSESSQADSTLNYSSPASSASDDAAYSGYEASQESYTNSSAYSKHTNFSAYSKPLAEADSTLEDSAPAPSTSDDAAYPGSEYTQEGYQNSSADSTREAEGSQNHAGSLFTTVEEEEEEDPTPVELRADPSLEAPETGGEFSKFFNKRLRGPGIHKWLQYFAAYKRHFAHFIGKKVHIVEIGVKSGGSLAMWKDVFGPGAHIYGLDTDPACKAYEDSQTKIVIMKEGDQEDPMFWENFRTQVPSIDILIDAGGHSLEEMTVTMGSMLPYMSENGTYIAEAIHDDMYGMQNDFWNLKFDNLTTPKGVNYEGLGGNVSSVHIYPFLMVVERRKSVGVFAMNRQLGSQMDDEPSGVRMLSLKPPKKADSEQKEPEVIRQHILTNVFPWLDWNDDGFFDKTTDLDSVLEELPPKGWLFVRDGKQEFSFDSIWEKDADRFFHKMMSQFMNLQKGSCCNPVANKMQTLVESLHIYPHLLIAIRDDGSRMLQAPKHGTQWHPPVRAMEMASTATTGVASTASDDE